MKHLSHHFHFQIFSSLLNQTRLPHYPVKANLRRNWCKSEVVLILSFGESFLFFLLRLPSQAVRFFPHLHPLQTVLEGIVQTILGGVSLRDAILGNLSASLFHSVTLAYLPLI